MTPLILSATAAIATLLLSVVPADAAMPAPRKSTKKKAHRHTAVAIKVYPSFLGPLFEELPSAQTIGIDAPEGVKEMREMTPVFEGDEEEFLKEVDTGDFNSYGFDTEGRLISYSSGYGDCHSDYRYTVTYDTAGNPESITLLWSQPTQDLSQPLMKYKYHLTYTDGRVSKVTEQLIAIDNKPITAPVYTL